jgi:hypothetical protein
MSLITPIKPPPAKVMHTFHCLRALCNAGNVGAATVGPTTSDRDTGPGPASAGCAATTCNNNIISAAGNGLGANDIREGQAGDRHTGVSSAVEVTTVVVLLDENTVSK